LSLLEISENIAEAGPEDQYPLQEQQQQQLEAC